ncbi:hypothetical protein FEM48_Zijuj06G0037100 [Ziziphus jujuba var. spinosa]|uniref:non-specific serine/threonine protein kinase n=1 Tax=Ziziphus jujuba var. spinosa TaxID=714518 RepID=A0A978V6Z1_ZIZJJ|nr:hypothetical protein FEM48_Zijuj06G0037100 [Ziziphus jujuba var. spinosa]
MANRDEPVYEKVSKLSLQKDGNLVLTDAGRLDIWATGTASLSPAFLYLHDNGNLMLNNSKGVLWQSFDSPTDTLLPLQLFTKSTKLVSSRSESNFSTGFYTFSFSDNNLLNLIFDNSEVSSVCWPPPWLVSWEAGRSICNNSRVAMLNSLGNFSSSDDFTFLATDYGSILQRRLRMDYDGNIRLYSRTNDGAEWYVSWEAIRDSCKINGICGVNGLCTYDYSSGRKCSCLPGYKMKNRTDWTKGCEPKFNPSCNRNDSKFIRLFSVEFYGDDYGFFPNYTLSQCEELCSSLCNCKGFQYSFFNTGIINCYPKTLLLNGYRTPSFFGDLYLRLPKSYHLPQEKTLEEFSLECSNVTAQELNRTYSKKHENQSVKLLLWFVTGVGGFQLICFVSVWDQGMSIGDHNIGGNGQRPYGERDRGDAWRQSRTAVARGGQESLLVELRETENRGLVSWVRENIKGSSSDVIEPSLEKIMDPSMGEQCDMMKMAKLLVVAMKCVEEEKGGRPTMSQVVEMLQDNH